MHEIGTYQGADPLRSDEENTHWGLWCIVSSPLILGLDMSISETMDRIWPTITASSALAICRRLWCIGLLLTDGL